MPENTRRSLMRPPVTGKANRARTAASKFEIRSTKSETKPKHQIRNPKQTPFAFQVLDFGFWVCFGFRASDFGFAERGGFPSPESSHHGCPALEVES
jgi:hypothetical protein